MLAMRIISTVILAIIILFLFGSWIVSDEVEDGPLVPVISVISILAVAFVLVTIWIV